MGKTELIEIHSGGLAAAITPEGAELQRLRLLATGQELLWHGDPAWWPNHAPLLFPIVGRCRDDLIRLGADLYPMAPHGFAKLSRFEVTEADAQAATFTLADSDATRAHYPFAFKLDVAYRLAGSTLTVQASLSNPGEAPLPASFGFHPGFPWPLAPGTDRNAHTLAFDEAEPEGIRYNVDRLMQPERRPTPVEGNVLHLRDALFEQPPLIFDQLRSRAVTYAGPGTPRIRVEFPDMPYLGVWTRPGSPLLCLEPWHGHSDPVDFVGDFTQKPGVALVPPGGQHQWHMRIEATPPRSNGSG